jgi:23S rRNA G2445 N2-methylase RlmL
MANARKAGVEKLIQFKDGDATKMSLPTDSGIIICNPPYGQRMMEQMLDTFESAKTKIESYKTSDPKRYQAILDNIVKESIFPRYLLLEAYSSTYSNAQLLEMKTSFRADVERLDINVVSEGGSMSDYLNANGY